MNREAARNRAKNAQNPGIEATDIIVMSRDDHALFADVFLPHLDEAYRLARWLTGNANDAEDVVQDAAIRAFRAVVTTDVTNPRAWSLTIVRNTAHSWMMKNRPTDVVYSDDPAAARHQSQRDAEVSAEPTPEDAAILKATAEEVRRALAALPTLFREIVVLRDIHDLSYRDIAAVTHLPIGTVMSRLSRGRQMLTVSLRHARP